MGDEFKFVELSIRLKDVGEVNDDDQFMLGLIRQLLKSNTEENIMR